MLLLFEKMEELLGLWFGWKFDDWMVGLLELVLELLQFLLPALLFLTFLLSVPALPFLSRALTVALASAGAGLAAAALA